MVLQMDIEEEMSGRGHNRARGGFLKDLQEQVLHFQLHRHLQDSGTEVRTTVVHLDTLTCALGHTRPWFWDVVLFEEHVGGTPLFPVEDFFLVVKMKNHGSNSICLCPCRDHPQRVFLDLTFLHPFLDIDLDLKETSSGNQGVWIPLFFFGQIIVVLFQLDNEETLNHHVFHRIWPGWRTMSSTFGKIVVSDVELVLLYVLWTSSRLPTEWSTSMNQIAPTVDFVFRPVLFLH